MAAVTQSKDGKKAMADEELPEEPETLTSSQRDGGGSKPPTGRGSPPGGPTPPTARGGTSGGAGGFFTIRKKGQGYWTRMGTAIGAGFLGAMFAYEIYDKLKAWLPANQANPHRDTQIAGAIALVFLLVYAAWAFWYTNKPSTVDFLIATDSEMKKVNWTTRKELIGSTKVVVIFMLIIALFLFLCDLLFGAFFQLIGVLKTMF